MASERIGCTQKDVMFTLLCLELYGRKQVAQSELLKLINKSKAYDIHRNNFRVSCEGLDDAGLIDRQLSSSLQYKVWLTDLGREQAKVILDEKGLTITTSGRIEEKQCERS